MISGKGPLTALSRWWALVGLVGALAVSGVGLWATWPSDDGAPAAATRVIEPSPTVPAELDTESLLPAGDQLPEGAPTGATFNTDWETDVARRSGISVIAVRAYGLAVLRLEKEQPGCRIGWTTLAGIGAVESGHGTEAGAVLRKDGSTSRPIVGPALDGTGGNAAIPADDSFQKFHGDPQWDHAVGPMQFISSTWARWGSDGDDDGTKDPSNIVDAAYAAGRYLCAAGTDLTQGSNWGEAIFSYNHSADYVAAVYFRAREYAQAG